LEERKEIFSINLELKMISAMATEKYEQLNFFYLEISDEQRGGENGL